MAAQESIISAANAVKADRQQQIDAANAAAEGERTGTSGTGVVGCGERCLAHLDQAAALVAGQPTLDASQDAIINAANVEKGAIEGRKAEDVNEAKNQLALNTGPVARERALWSLLLSDGGMMAKYLILTALFLLLEMAAVITKLSTRGNNYELSWTDRIGRVHAASGR